MLLDEEARVRVARVVQHLGGGALFDHVAVAHDEHFRADLGDDGEVVRDDEEGEPRLLAEVGEEVEDLGLDGDVERRRRLVGDQDAGPGRERGGDQDALEHPAGQLVGVLGADPGGFAQVDLGEEFGGALAGRATAEVLLDTQHLAELTAHGERGVEVGGGVLEDGAEGGAP
ncbi:putative ABC transporter ATP-binding protein [Streptomyces sp. Tu6071]|nr:putative ABC transporter ATP-binding protein [Streptomyces sp. Tu6071]